VHGAPAWSTLSLVVVLLTLLALAWLAQPTTAGPRAAWAGHGGVVQLNRAPAGPYALSVWTQPAPPRAGAWQVDIAVMRDGGLPVSDAVVRVRAEPVGGGATPVETEARRADDPLGVRYRAALTLAAAGPWMVSVSVAGPAGPASLSFPVDVKPASPAWWLGAAITAVGLALLAGATVVRRRRVAVAALGLLVLLLSATLASAHASLVRSSPARRATVTAAPDRVQLWFNEAIEPKFSSVSVWDAGGQQVDLADARVEPEDPKRLTVGLKPLGRGTYRVRFRVLSVDGHVVESEFPFTLRP
jgi:copper resistance protein C